MEGVKILIYFSFSEAASILLATKNTSEYFFKKLNIGNLLIFTYEQTLINSIYMYLYMLRVQAENLIVS